MTPGVGLGWAGLIFMGLLSCLSRRCSALRLPLLTSHYRTEALQLPHFVPPILLSHFLLKSQTSVLHSSRFAEAPSEADEPESPRFADAASATRTAEATDHGPARPRPRPRPATESPTTSGLPLRSAPGRRPHPPSGLPLCAERPRRGGESPSAPSRRPRTSPSTPSRRPRTASPSDLTAQ